jgi:hypothetical protein
MRRAADFAISRKVQLVVRETDARRPGAQVADLGSVRRVGWCRSFQRGVTWGEAGSWVPRAWLPSGVDAFDFVELGRG